MTPSSITLEWSANNPGGGQALKYYRVEGRDISTDFNLPTCYTTDTTITYDSLEIGHTYRFDVSASYCPNGPFGERISIEATTGYIIVDIVMELQNPCSPEGRNGTTSGMIFDFCVQQSTNQESPYTNGFVGLLKVDDDNIFQFGVAAVIASLLSGSSAKKHKDNGLTPPKPALRSSNMTMISRPNPNPFSESVTFSYNIEEAGPVVINLYDAMGRLVRTVENTAVQPAGRYDLSIDGAGLPDGVYFLHVLTGENRNAFALVKRE